MNPIYPDDSPEFDEHEDYLEDESQSQIENNAIADMEDLSRPIYRGSTSDPIFGFLIAIALSIGLTPLLPANADMRYTLAWGALAGVGVLSWLLGSNERIAQEKPENVAWGIAFGILLGAPFLVFGGPILVNATRLIFPQMSVGTLLAYLIFVMPISETLFFRGLLQRQLDFWLVGLLGTFWNIVLFFPVMWEEVVTKPYVAVVIIIALLMMNMIYVYLRERNGLASAWICQIIANLVMVFIPFL